MQYKHHHSTWKVSIKRVHATRWFDSYWWLENFQRWIAQVSRFVYSVRTSTIIIRCWWWIVVAALLYIISPLYCGSSLHSLTFPRLLFTLLLLYSSRGIYLLLEKCKTVCYRNLFKRIHGILQGHLNLQDVAKAFKWMGMGATDLDEVECILANLIFRGYIRGYISHTKRVLVLSKSNPFPKSAVVKE